jgi:hypothetical protein
VLREYDDREARVRLESAACEPALERIDENLESQAQKHSHGRSIFRGRFASSSGCFAVLAVKDRFVRTAR